MILPFAEKSPRIAADVFIAPDSWVTGDVAIGTGSSVFFGAVLRGDLMPIRIGEHTNVQDHVIIHTTHNLAATEIGDGVSIGHRAVLHSCRVESNSLIGMGAIILDEAHIGQQCLIAAGALITSKMQIPDGSLVMGMPGKVVRQLSEQEKESILETAERYRGISAEYARRFA